MKLFTELTLKQQALWADWHYDPGTKTRPPVLADQRSKARLTSDRGPRGGWIGLASKWVDWLDGHPARLVDAVTAYNNATLPAIKWYPRVGDWVVFTQLPDAPSPTGVYRVECTGQAVQVVGSVDVQLEEDGEFVSAHRVQGVWAGFGHAELVTWNAYQGELRPATPDEVAQAKLARDGAGL
jgi:hypothetical protein